jgi:hypothetical protein
MLSEKQGQVTVAGQRLVNETYLALMPAIERLRNGTQVSEGSIGELIAIVTAWADYAAYGAVWIGGALKPCDTVLQAMQLRLGVAKQ